VGLPGILLALWVWTLREPVRGAMDGIYTEPEPHPFREFFLELRAVFPGFSLYHLAVSGARRGLIVGNVAVAAAIAVVAALLIEWTGNVAQWVALGIGFYAAASWVQGLALRDRPSAELIFGSPALRNVCLGLSFLAFTGYGFGAWIPIFLRRVHLQSASEVGNWTGITAALAGLVGVTLGGFIADRLRRGRPEGRILFALSISLLPIPLGLWMVSTENVLTAYLVNIPLTVLASAWIGVGASTVQDLVLPRMRAIASAFYILIITFIGLALGPYVIGQLSDGLGDLAAAMRWSLLANVVAFLFLLLALRHLARDEATRLDRARAAGEPLAADPGAA
jgi:hypothetical protein